MFTFDATVPGYLYGLDCYYDIISTKATSYNSPNMSECAPAHDPRCLNVLRCSSALVKTPKFSTEIVGARLTSPSSVFCCWINYARRLNHPSLIYTTHSNSMSCDKLRWGRLRRRRKNQLKASLSPFWGLARTNCLGTVLAQRKSQTVFSRF